MQKENTQSHDLPTLQVSGIHPLDICVFQDRDFAPAYVTDRPVTSNVPTDGSGDANYSSCVDDSAEPDIPSSYPGQDEPHLTASPETVTVLTAANQLTTPVNSIDTVFVAVNTQLREINREVASVPGDGHCLLYALAIGLAEEGIEVTTSEKLGTMLVTEINENIEHYSHFSNGRNVSDDINRYVHFKEFNNDTADLILSALCNCLGISAIIYHHTTSGTTNIIAAGPSRQHLAFRGDVYLVLTGSNGNEHYSGVRQTIADAQAVTASIENIQGNIKFYFQHDLS